MAYNRRRAAPARRRATKRPSSYRARSGTARRASSRRGTGSTIRIVIENPNMSQVARPFQTPAAPPKQAKF